MKLPAFQFYPGDWRKDSGVQSLDFEARGVWIEMLCLMHESTPRGFLTLNGKAMPEQALARLLGIDLVLLKQILTKLVDHGVVSVDPETGAMMSRRMVRDDELRKTRAECGKQGGNPSLLKQKSTTGVKQIPTPSVSSSSSVSSSDNTIPPPPSGGGGKEDAGRDGRHHAITSQWGESYRATFGHDYTFNGRDASALKRFLGSCKDDAGTILQVARDAWERTRSDRFAGRCKEAATIHGLCGAYNEIRAQLAMPTANGRTAGTNPHQRQAPTAEDHHRDGFQ